MRTTLSRDPSWARRHRLPHDAFKRGKARRPLDEKTTKRFGMEFERALRARGAEAKQAMEANSV